MLLTVILKKNIFDSLQIHIDGLVSSVRLIGTGLGTAGNYAIWNSGKEITDAGESYWGAIMAQVGGVALCLFIMAFVRIFRIIGNKTQSILSKTVVAYIIASLIESMLSESAISYVGNGLAFVFLGIIYRRSLNISKKEMKI